MVECTFKPLSRGRYKCFQTGAVVKQRRLKGYRNQRINGGRKALQPLPARIRMPVVRIAHHTRVADCPRCHNFQDVFDGLNTCNVCRQNFEVVRELKIARFWLGDTRTECPHCYHMVAIDGKVGKHTCPSCHCSFMLKYW